MLILAVVGWVDMDVGSLLWSYDRSVSGDTDDIELITPITPIYIYKSLGFHDAPHRAPHPPPRSLYHTSLDPSLHPSLPLTSTS